MSLEREGKPSMAEIVEAEIKQWSDHVAEINAKSPETSGYILREWLNNFPCNLPNSAGVIKARKVRDAIISGRSYEEFKQDLRTAVDESGVDKKALGEYVDFILNNGISEGSDETHRELLLPVFIKLREKGYTKLDLTR